MQGFEDRLDDLLRPGKHIGVPETQDAKSGRPQEHVATKIICRAFDVLRSVQLNDKTALERSEVANVQSDLMLPAELDPGQLAAPQMAPEFALGVGLVLSKSAAVSLHPRIWA